MKKIILVILIFLSTNIYSRNFVVRNYESITCISLICLMKTLKPNDIKIKYLWLPAICHSLIVQLLRSEDRNGKKYTVDTDALDDVLHGAVVILNAGNIFSSIILPNKLREKTCSYLEKISLYTYAVFGFKLFFMMDFGPKY